MGAAPILQCNLLAGISTQIKLEDQVSQLESDLTSHHFPYSLRFQLQRLWTNTHLSPHEVRDLLPSIARVRDQSGYEVAEKVVRRLSNQIPYGGPEVEPSTLGLTRLSRLIEIAEISLRDDRYRVPLESQSKGEVISVYKATVTPTGLYLEGPDEEASNRVLRRYRAHTEFFLRVSFLEEDGERILFDRDSSNEKIFQERFKFILRNGIGMGEPQRFIRVTLPFQQRDISNVCLRSSRCSYPHACL